jgi:predicted O-methyltransferase YrrM
LRKFTNSELGVTPIPGPFSTYLNANETAILVALVKRVRPRVMIEFGCNTGMTARRVLDHVPSLEKYIGIDVPSYFRTFLECQRDEVPRSPGCFADDARFFLHVSASQLLGLADLEPCDAAFIDGDHSRDAVMHDSRLARRLVKRGGVIVWHDYLNPAVEVTGVIEQLAREGWPIDAIDNSWIAFCEV